MSILSILSSPSRSKGTRSASDAALDVTIDRLVREHATEAEAAAEVHRIVDEHKEH